MKKSILIILASIFLSYPTNLIGGDYETLHEFKSGDIISAEMMNELFDYIKNSNKMISASELIGTWSCEFYTQTSGCGLLTTLGPDSLYRSDNTTLVMARLDNGTYTYTSTIPNLFNCADSADNGTGLGHWVVRNNILFHDVYKWGIKGDPSVEGQTKFAKLKRVSNTKFLMEMGSAATTVFAECDKQNLPPTTPATLTASASGTTVSLAWSDNSTNERNFNVLRRDSCDGSFSIVDNVTENVTSSTDTVPAAGSYWYRVSATNDNGTSVPGKMVRVDVE